ncbi:hypothetical protein ES707_21369 [subsurface metagenome]
MDLHLSLSPRWSAINALSSNKSGWSGYFCNSRSHSAPASFILLLSNNALTVPISLATSSLSHSFETYSASLAVLRLSRIKSIALWRIDGSVSIVVIALIIVSASFSGVLGKYRKPVRPSASVAATPPTLCTTGIHPQACASTVTSPKLSRLDGRHNTPCFE